MPTPRFAAWMFSASLMVAGAGMVSSQPYPSKPMRIVTAAVGGGADFAARLIAPGLSARLGQPIVIENRGGQGVSIDIVAKAPFDGYTLLYTGNPFWLSPFMRDDVPYDALRDFSPIALVVRVFSILVVNPAAQVTSVKELIALAKAKPGELNYASLMTGSGPHLSAELFKAMAGLDIVGIRYAGAAQGLNDLLGGRVQFMFPTAASGAPHVNSGRLRALAVTSAQPSALYPSLPTMAASGLPGYESVVSYGMFARIRTPDAIVNRLSEEIARTAVTADIKERFFSAGSEVVGSSPQQFAAAIKSDKAILGKIIKDAGIREE